MAQSVTGSIITRQKSVPKVLNQLSYICLSVDYPCLSRLSRVFDQVNAWMLGRPLLL